MSIAATLTNQTCAFGSLMKRGDTGFKYATSTETPAPIVLVIVAFCFV